jgi:hypothetical protein
MTLPIVHQIGGMTLALAARAVVLACGQAQCAQLRSLASKRKVCPSVARSWNERPGQMRAAHLEGL